MKYIQGVIISKKNHFWSNKTTYVVFLDDGHIFSQTLHDRWVTGDVYSSYLVGSLMKCIKVYKKFLWFKLPSYKIIGVWNG